MIISNADDLLKGQLHLHTNISDGKKSPEEVANIYKSLGYDFIVFTDHKKNYAVKDYVKNSISDFIMIPGIEWDFIVDNCLGYDASLHLNALGYSGKDFNAECIVNNIPKTLENMVDAACDLGAIPMINHPNWRHSFNYRELLKVDRNYLLEIANIDPESINEGNLALESVEYTWDVLLSNGKGVFVTATDDAHYYMPENICDGNSSPGNSFVMCMVKTFDEAGIRESLINGDFYASTGVVIDKYEETKKGISVSVKAEDDKKHVIIFKGRMGIPLKIVEGVSGDYEFTGSYDEEYVRVKIIDSKDRAAFTQPVFKNGKKIVIENKI